METRSHHLTTDVLVVGGGIAGCFAAIKASEEGARVLIASKATVGHSGCTLRAASVYLGFDPEQDDLDEWVREAVEISFFLDDPNIERQVIEQSYILRKMMEAWGVEWRLENGKLYRRPGLGMKAMRNAYFYGGAQMMWVIRGQVRRRGIGILERVMITDLLVSDENYPTRGKVIGAVGFDIRKGDFYWIDAGSVILAAGDWGVKSGFHPSDCTGDGQATAYRVGAEMRNMEQTAYSISPVIAPAQPGLHLLTGHGAVLVNSLGERFMEKYSPNLKERSPRSLVAQSLAKEIQEGRGPIYMDISHLEETDLSRLEALLPQLFKMISRAGQDFKKDRIQFAPVNYGNSSSGGVRLNENSETSVEALFVAGGNSDRMYAGCPGLTGASVTGYIAGMNSALYALNHERVLNKPDYISLLKDKIYAPIHDKGKYDPVNIIKDIRNLVDTKIGLLKNAVKLQSAINEFDNYRDVVFNLKAESFHDLKNVHELRNIVQLGSVIARASLYRKESRYFNYREDYPERDDVNWFKWIITKLGHKHELDIWTENIPPN